MNRSWIEFLRLVSKASGDTLETFFRGQADANWPLVPSLGRRRFPSRLESNLYYDFLTHSASLVASGVDSWDLLFMMRHHSVPTRLLDWTQSFAVALYFAMGSKDSTGAIFVLDPYKLNKKTWDSDTIPHPQADLEEYYDYFISDKTKEFPAKAMAIQANRNTPRVIAQRGVFTIHKDLQHSLEQICPSSITKIAIPLDAKKDAKLFLKMAGINRYSIFPELDGLGSWLSEYYALDEFPLKTPDRAKPRKRP